MTDKLTDAQLTHERAQNIRGAIGLLTEDEVAKVLLLTSVDTLATWRSQKRGPTSVKLGKRVFYTTGDLQQWVQKSAQEQYAAANSMPGQLAA